ncbi:MAG: hypothetical protein KGH63_00965 [Candidatus Micrarchaeota archaeon]|nr:hypothetical protein [Candidatus Micrarchaeota archaeon]
MRRSKMKPAARATPAPVGDNERVNYFLALHFSGGASRRLPLCAGACAPHPRAKFTSRWDGAPSFYARHWQASESHLA